LDRLAEGRQFRPVPELDAAVDLAIDLALVEAVALFGGVGAACLFLGVEAGPLLLWPGADADVDRGALLYHGRISPSAGGASSSITRRRSPASSPSASVSTATPRASSSSRAARTSAGARLILARSARSRTSKAPAPAAASSRRPPGRSARLPRPAPSSAN